MVNPIHTWSLLGCVGVVLLVARADTAYAQPSSEPAEVMFWLNAGLGRSSVGWLAGNAGGSIQYGSGLVSLRITANVESFDYRGSDKLYDLGLLFGLASRGTKGHASIAAGTARVTGSRYDHGKRGFDPVIGLPVEVQFFRHFGSFFGLGVNAFANVNAEQSFAGISLNLRLGKLR